MIETLRQWLRRFGEIGVMPRPELRPRWQRPFVRLFCLVAGHHWTRSRTRRELCKCGRCGLRIAVEDIRRGPKPA